MADTKGNDYPNVPLREVSAWDQRIDAEAEGLFRVMRFRVVDPDPSDGVPAPQYLRFSIGRSGKMELRSGDDGQYVEIGHTNGQRNGTALHVKLWVPAASDIIYTARASGAETFYVTVVREYDAVVQAEAEQEIVAYPIQKAPISAGYRATFRTNVQLDHLSVTVEIDGTSKTEPNESSSYVHIPKADGDAWEQVILAKRSAIRVTKSMSSDTAQPTIGFTAMPLTKVSKRE